MNALIKSAKIIDTNSKFNGKTVDILIEKGIISKIGKDLKNPKKIQEINFKGLHVSTGWFDMRANFCDPGHEYKEDLNSGLKAAAKGGFTGVMVMPDTNPTASSKGGIEYIINKTKGNIVDALPAGSLSHNCEGKEIAEMYDMHSAGAIAFTDNKKSIEKSSLLNRALLYSQSFNGLIIDFPNNQELSNGGQINEGVVSTQLGLKGMPALAEELMVNRDIYLAEYCNARIHLSNISTKKSVQLIKEAKKNGLRITADVNSYHLLLDESSLLNFDNNCKVTPPLRTKEDIKALVNGLKDGTIDVICSDHTPEDIENKQCEFDNAAFGMINLQTSFAAANSSLNSKLTLEEIITKTTSAPREILNIENPIIKEGEQANLTLFNPQTKWSLQEKEIVSKAKNTPLIDKELTGKVYGVVNNNQLMID
ncbi:MAG: dihydroorotase [Flavobacteriales bacterium]|nr:dihydroorotase [Flavobacteriales bacterium]